MSLTATADSPTIAGDLFDDLLPEKDAARKELKVSPQTLAKYRKDGVGPKFTVIKRKIFYQRVNLRAWVDNGGAQQTADETRAVLPPPRKAKKSKPARKRRAMAGAR
jgi:hypothetical protein